MMRQARVERTYSRVEFDCSVHPKLCQAPFNCGTFNLVEATPWSLWGIAALGHSNPRTWCTAPLHDNYISTCLAEKDSVKAAHIQYEWSRERAPLDELDASYCFLEGICQDTFVNASTTIEEADKLCDRRYGHSQWTHYGNFESLGGQAMHFLKSKPASLHKGFTDRTQTQ